MKQKSLRQIAKELGVSPSYLSQVKNGKRPPSDKVLSNPNVLKMLNVKQDVKQKIALSLAPCYNLPVLGNRLVVGQRTLDP